MNRIILKGSGCIARFEYRKRTGRIGKLPAGQLKGWHPLGYKSPVIPFAFKYINTASENVIYHYPNCTIEHTAFRPWGPY
jgi:hypothetical protein